MADKQQVYWSSVECKTEAVRGKRKRKGGKKEKKKKTGSILRSIRSSP
jgi:hypothetical protein